MSVVHTLKDAAEQGGLDPKKRQTFTDFRLRHLSLSRSVSVFPSQLGGIRWADLDTVEQRYLLTAAADSTLEAFDVLCADDGGGSGAPGVSVELLPLFTVKRGTPTAHRYQVTCVSWYPVDTGLFVTGSADQEVKVWDTNTVQLACSFSCVDKVLSLAMSPCAASHTLIAVGTRQQGLVLADIASGAFTHTLDGHRNGTWCVCWSPANEYQLFSGDGAGAVRLWDIRCAGCRALLDLNTTQRSKPTAPASTTATFEPAATTSNAATVNRKRTRPSGQQQQQEGSSVVRDGAAGAGGVSGVASGSAVAHEGSVSGLMATPEGLHLVTAGLDHRVRLWDATYLHHQLVHYSNTFNKGAYPKRMSTTPDGRVLFYPRGSDIQVFDITTGQDVALLSQGHYDTVTACVYSPRTGHLWSTGLDGAVLAWAPWTQTQQVQDTSTPHYMDSWTAAVTAGRGRRDQQQQQQQAVGGDNQRSGSVAGGVAGRAAALPDIDFWSDDEGLLVGV